MYPDLMSLDNLKKLALKMALEAEYERGEREFWIDTAQNRKDALDGLKKAIKKCMETEDAEACMKSLAALAATFQSE